MFPFYIKNVEKTNYCDKILSWKHILKCIVTLEILGNLFVVLGSFLWVDNVLRPRVQA